MINAGFNQESGNKVIEDGYANMVAYGRLFISNPDLPFVLKKMKSFKTGIEIPFYVPGEKGYTDYPKLNEEKVS